MQYWMLLLDRPKNTRCWWNVSYWSINHQWNFVFLFFFFAHMRAFKSFLYWTWANRARMEENFCFIFFSGTEFNEIPLHTLYAQFRFTFSSRWKVKKNCCLFINSHFDVNSSVSCFRRNLFHFFRVLCPLE